MGWLGTQGGRTVDVGEASTGVRHYRNGLYVGHVEGSHPQGLGLLAMDDGDAVLGFWQQGALEGEYVYLGDRVRAMGRLTLRGQLEGFQVVRYTHSWKQ